MQIGELVRCPRCNSENPPEYRFCGMCGTPLDKPIEPPIRNVDPVTGSEPARRREPAAPAPPPPQTLSGPSFLGLSSPSRGTEDVTYLFEEEQPKRTYWRFLLILLVLGIVGGLGWLQLKSNKSWTPPWANQKPSTPEQASQQPAPAPQPQASSQPAQNPPQNGQPAAQNQPGNTPQPKETDIAPGANPPANGSNAAQPPASGPEAAKPEQTPPAADTTTKKAPEATPGATKVAKNQAAADQGTAADNSAADNAADETPVAKPKPARAKPTPVPANPDDALVANAEKYLYGNGVPQNCDRALVSLRSAADRQNARAQSLLGTMYGTGHCVPRDLPNAYRWFALASRQQSDNMWIQRNLEMIWREMTPQERQLAVQSNR